MSTHLTEEEQLEALKRWWNDNGKWVLTAIVLSVGGYFGWNAWQDQRTSQALAASAQYEALLSSADGGELNPGLVEDIKQNHSNSQYAYNAAFLRAQNAVQNNDLATAAGELQWIMDQTSRGAAAELARVRLARVLIAQSNYDEALSLLDQARPSDSFASKYAEARGDALLGQGDHDRARAAYQSALAGLGPEAQNRLVLLEMKLDDLASAATTTPTTGRSTEVEVEENAS